MTEPEPIGPGTLKLIVVDAERDVAALIESALHDRIGPGDVRRIGRQVFVAHCNAEPQDIRDWLAPLLLDDETLLVAEFERWSSRGNGVDRRWMLRRGH